MSLVPTLFFELITLIDVVLELLAVHPDYQRRGAGTPLVSWGTKVANEKGVMVSALLLSFSPFIYFHSKYIKATNPFKSG